MKFKIFQSFPRLVYGLSGRAEGSMNLKLQPNETGEAYAANRRKLFDKLGVAKASVVFAVSRHQADLARAGTQEQGKRLENIDGLVSNAPGTFLALTVADCVPVYLFDPVKSAFGLLHGGWRGIAAGIVPVGIKFMAQNFGSRPEDILLATGPCIQKCHFEVQDDVSEKFKDYPSQIFRGSSSQGAGDPSVTTLDLPEIVRVQATGAGLLRPHIETSNACTFCLTKRYFSYRRDRIVPLQTMLAYMVYTPALA